MRFFATATVRDLGRGAPIGSAATVKVQLDAEDAPVARALVALEAERAVAERYNPWLRMA